MLVSHISLHVDISCISCLSHLAVLCRVAWRADLPAWFHELADSQSRQPPREIPCSTGGGGVAMWAHLQGGRQAAPLAHGAAHSLCWRKPTRGHLGPTLPASPPRPPHTRKRASGASSPPPHLAAEDPPGCCHHRGGAQDCGGAGPSLLRRGGGCGTGMAPGWVGWGGVGVGGAGGEGRVQQQGRKGWARDAGAGEHCARWHAPAALAVSHP